MRKEFVEELSWNGKPFSLQSEEVAGSEILSGTLRCGNLTVPIRNGVPEFVTSDQDAGARQVQQIFSKYWNTILLDANNPGKREIYVDGFRKLMMADRLEQAQSDTMIRKYLQPRKRILDAGCGPGWAAKYFRANDEQRWYSVDFGESAFVAYENLRSNPNNTVIRASLFELPFQQNYFDLIVSNGVLHHTPDPRGGFKSLVRHLAPGGDIAIGMIRRQTPIRDYADKFIREHTTNLSIEDNLKFAASITALGKELQRHNITLNIPAGLDLLGIDPGEYTLHRFIHCTLLKCFHSSSYSEEENLMQGLDWYAVKYAWPHTEEELAQWFKEEGLTNIEIWRPKHSSEAHEMIRIKGTKPR